MLAYLPRSCGISLESGGGGYTGEISGGNASFYFSTPHHCTGSTLGGGGGVNILESAGRSGSSCPFRFLIGPPLCHALVPIYGAGVTPSLDAVVCAGGGAGAGCVGGYWVASDYTQDVVAVVSILWCGYDADSPPRFCLYDLDGQGFSAVGVCPRGNSGVIGLGELAV